MEVIIIAAMAANRVIGANNDIPWHIPDELQRFKETTMGHGLIMGRKTYESIGHPLPGRKTIIISRNSEYQVPGCTIVESIDEALEVCNGEQKAFIAGGGEIYKEALKIAESIRLTVLDRSIDGDVFFPEFSEDEFQLVSSERIEGNEPYSIFVYHRN